MAAVLALTEPGDEVLVLEPWYENYVPACALAGAVPRFVPLSEPGFGLDPGRLERAVTPAHAAHPRQHARQSVRPRVLARGARGRRPRSAQRHGLIAVTDEIYEHMWYDGHRHVSLASLPGMEDRTVTLSGLGKTYAVTGWRVGWAVAAPKLTALVRKVHDYLTICAPTPFQEAGVAALRCRRAYYEDLRRTYAARRAILLDALDARRPLVRAAGGRLLRHGRRRAASAGRTTGSSSTFSRGRSASSPFRDRASTARGGKTRARLNFAKKEATLREAARRLTARSLRAPK